MQNQRVGVATTSGADVVGALTRMVADGAQQITTLIRSAEPLLQAYSALLSTAATLPSTALDVMSPAVGSALRTLRSSAGCCEIPETECPPRCVCEMTWEGTQGDRLSGTITLRNTRRSRQTFAVATKPFHGPRGDTGVALSVSATAVPLDPGQTATITLSFEVPDTFAIGAVYAAEVTITGLYEQCICVTLDTRPARHCEVQQGEIPKRIRAHRWYDHFQCEELCFEPAVHRRFDDQSSANG